MGLEYKIETYDAVRVKLPEFLRELPEFLREEQGAFHLGSAPSNVLFTVSNDKDHIHVCQHVASRETDALLGLLIRRILSLNDHAVISELSDRRTNGLEWTRDGR